MFNSKLRRQNDALAARIKELEGIICPIESHDWQKVLEEYEPDGIIGDLFRVKTKYICRKCRKEKYESVLE